jgi:uncharacterized membrane protein
MTDTPTPSLARRAALVVLALAFVGVGVAHFVAPEPFEAIVPPFLPAPRLLVWLSGAAEIGLGLATLPPKTRPWAGWGLLLLLVAVFPANVYMALDDTVAFPGQPPPPRWAAWGRLPIQLVLAAWALWATDAWSLVRARRSRAATG